MIRSNRAIIAFLAALLFAAMKVMSASSLTDDQKRLKVEEMATSYQPLTPDLPLKSVEEFLNMRAMDRVILIDVRTEAERKVSFIPGSIGLEDFEKQRSAYMNWTVVAYCTTGYRSGQYANQLKDKNYHAFNLRGGVLAWAHAKQQFTSAQGKTTKVHVYGKEWNLLPKGYQAVW